MQEKSWMSIVTLESTVEKGQIRLPSDLRLSDKTKVNVVIPGIQVENLAYVYSPQSGRPISSH